MNRYQSYFRKLNVFFSGKQQDVATTDQKNFFIGQTQKYVGLPSSGSVFSSTPGPIGKRDSSF